MLDTRSIQNYFINDADGNTPLLKAAQPSTEIERETALQRLKDRLEAGTLIIEKIPSKKRLHFLFDKSYGATSRAYEEILAPKDPDIVFDLLMTTRNDFVNLFNNIKSTLVTQKEYKKIQEEIFYHFISHNLKCTTDADQNIVNAYVEKKSEVDNLANLIATRLNIKKTNISSFQLLAFLKKNGSQLGSNLTFIQQLENQLQELQIKQIAFATYLNKPNVFDTYLEAIAQSKITISHRAMLIFASLMNIKLKIWSKNADNSLKLLGYNSGGNTFQEHLNIVILNTAGFDFNLLRKVEAMDLSPSQTSNYHILRIKKIYDPLNERNFLQQNILHLAVKSIAADILVPYLIRDCGFKTLLNQVDIFGRTPSQIAMQLFTNYPQPYSDKFRINYLDIALACQYPETLSTSTHKKRKTHITTRSSLLEDKETQSNLEYETISLQPSTKRIKENNSPHGVVPTLFFKDNPLLKEFLKKTKANEEDLTQTNTHCKVE